MGDGKILLQTYHSERPQRVDTMILPYIAAGLLFLAASMLIGLLVSTFIKYIERSL